MQCEPEPDGTRNLHKLSLVNLLRIPGGAPALFAAAIERAQRANLPTTAHVADLICVFASTKPTFVMLVICSCGMPGADSRDEKNQASRKQDVLQR